MNINKGDLIAVLDGETFKLFTNSGEPGAPKLTEQETGKVETDNKGSGGRHGSSSANPSDSQQDEDAFAAGAADLLNKKMMGGSIEGLVVIAAPRTLGELRKHYHKTLTAKLTGEIDKDLTGHSLADIEKALEAA